MIKMIIGGRWSEFLSIFDSFIEIRCSSAFLAGHNNLVAFLPGCLVDTGKMKNNHANQH